MSSDNETNNVNKLGLPLLIAVIISSVIGGGVFDLPADMSRHAGTLAVLIGWVITTIGMFCLVLVFRNLTRRKPECKGGIYTYARELFGKYIAFNSAWGYWVSAFVANVAYMVLIFGTLSYFFPVFGTGNNIYSLIGGSIVIWTIHFIALRGVKDAAIINTVTTIARLVPIALFLVALLFAFNMKNLSFEFIKGGDLGSMFSQVKSTMMVTVWIFLGIEGAVVMSNRAKNMKDVGKATVISFFITLMIYFLVSFLSMAAVPREILIKMPKPSVGLRLGICSWIMGRLYCQRWFNYCSFRCGAWMVHSCFRNALCRRERRRNAEVFF